ncbi:Clp protease ClpB [Algoriphagus sanaruensis]|uniref:Clp protease ClpB n=1 Tax=Algoriphagus sanaruensis TaxID=1727163 RepID=A0A142EL12_9BACT|nr:Clp protease ClpB [Algoriphagus sanaruensis]AMQ55817.1 Clp protease ClpB [Algoriphagus sanaruensis]
MLTFIFGLWLSLLQSDSLDSFKLQKLISERDQLHEEWKTSETKKTGIFGNRTKKDMVETNEWLIRIIQKDNQIMDELRMQGTIDKVTISQEREDYKSITMKLEREVQILKRVILEKDEEISARLSERRIFEWSSLILFLISAGLGWWIYRIKKASAG